MVILPLDFTKLIIRFFFLILFVNPVFVFPQSSPVDSLENILNSLNKFCPNPCKEDTFKINIINKLTWEYIKAGDYESSNRYIEKVFEISNGIHSSQNEEIIRAVKVGLANAISYQGIIHSNKGDYKMALEFYNKAFEIDTEISNKKGMAKRMGNTGNIYLYQGDYTTALEYYGKALKLSEKAGNKKDASLWLGNIGGVYNYQGNYPRALDYFLKAMKIDQEIGNKEGLGRVLSNIGLIYYNQKDFSKALEIYFRALKLNQEIGNKNNISTALGNIGNVYSETGNYPKALNYIQQALRIDEEITNNEGIARHLGNIGNVYSNQSDSEFVIEGLDPSERFLLADKFFSKALAKNEELGNKKGMVLNLGNKGVLNLKYGKLKEAESFFLKAISLGDEIGNIEVSKEWNRSLSQLYEQQGKSEKALKHFKAYITGRDSIFNEENTRKLVRSEMNFDFEKQQAIEKAEQEKKDLAHIEEVKRQKLVIFSVIAGFLMVVIFSFFLFNRFKITQKQKKIIEEQKEFAEHQKEIVEEKQKEIIDSINYAKRIQQALLKENENPKDHLPEHFILFKPKDIVSGDFFWTLEKQDHWYVAVADCTGHGVPGAFMSMLGIAFLNEINATENLLTPAEILDRLRDKVLKELGHVGNGPHGSIVKDGMDISLARINLVTNELQWAGANNALYLLKANPADKNLPDLIEVRADKQPIGAHPHIKPFSNHIFELKKGEGMFLFSDGFADQFGGPKEKKFKYKQLEDILLANALKPIIEQKNSLDLSFQEWKSSYDQVDDVCLMGIRI